MSGMTTRSAKWETISRRSRAQSGRQLIVAKNILNAMFSGECECRWEENYTIRRVVPCAKHKGLALGRF